MKAASFALAYGVQQTTQAEEVEPSKFNVDRPHRVGQYLTYDHPHHAEAKRVIQQNRREAREFFTLGARARLVNA
ncbi:hypothetical protein DF152_17195 [Burkholderia cenocepacia]|nr:hypothetical protein DF152_17195 [Burkholderia cenocepacia]